ncbi:hypothetical protein O0881_00140 [Janthinobacterium sp. SUN100]|uniref:hypothetical protein n=1 Tax=Janthinobacterium sp. SUN100 TaxID=3004101 RepID=UPI0025AFE76F|nr:hypothetical protein [Janthinobacterium sp. SUN100]MDN2700398.1 hypothetical protein [Janthinobacterium sp. SUN100]
MEILQSDEAQLTILPFCGFYVRRLFQKQPVAISGLLFSFVLAAGACYASWYWEWESQVLTEQLREAKSLRVAPALVTVTAVSNAVALPTFSSSEFTEQFSAIAREAKVPLDELFYVLETGQAQPFWRYRITIEIKTGYPELRNFIAALSSALPNVALDTIHCRREDVAAAGLACQLTLSAFFRKKMHG